MHLSGTYDSSVASAAFEEIYESVRRWPGVQRGGSLAPAVIGEGMPRATQAAQAFGADTYPGFANVDGLTGDALNEARLSDNASWINNMMSQGRTIIDIGPQLGRAGFPGVTSDAYAMELQEIEGAGYSNVIQPYDNPILLNVP